MLAVLGKNIESATILMLGGWRRPQRPSAGHIRIGFGCSRGRRAIIWRGLPVRTIEPRCMFLPLDRLRAVPLWNSIDEEKEKGARGDLRGQTVDFYRRTRQSIKTGPELHSRLVLDGGKEADGSGEGRQIMRGFDDMVEPAVIIMVGHWRRPQRPSAGHICIKQLNRPKISMYL